VLPAPESGGIFADMCAKGGVEALRALRAAAERASASADAKP
jgi:hypothetical protein